MSDRNLWTEKYDATAEKDPKFGSKPMRCSQGQMHQSRLEARRCTELHLMVKGGLIRDLVAHPQPRYRLEVSNVHVCDYMPDFVYVDCESGQTIVEDCKGRKTREYSIKEKLMRALHGITIQEIGRLRVRRRL
jgi:hypothetical protein